MGLLTAPLVPAQSSPVPPPDQQSQVSAEKEQLSSHLSTLIKESLPAYTPPAIKTPEPAPPEHSDVVVLPKMVITGDTPRKFAERELDSKAGRTRLLRQRYPGAVVPPDSHLPNYAALMLAEDERLEHIAELENIAEALQATGEAKMAKDFKDEIARGFARGHDAMIESMDRSYNRR